MLGTLNSNKRKTISSQDSIYRVRFNDYRKYNIREILI
nr:MAG TPA: hypothetical protein [Caudoviricetes sp.]